MPSPNQDPNDPTFRSPLDRSLPWPPSGVVSHPNLKEQLYSALGPEHVVVDVGCGPGPFEYDKYEARFIAFDMFDVESRLGFRAGRDEFRKATLKEFPLADCEADAVVMGFILEHVEEPLIFLKEAERVLKPGGWCYVAVPHHRSLEDRLFRLATTLVGSTRGPHIQRFTLENLHELIEGNTRMEIQAWHPLKASWLWINHPRIRILRKPFLSLLHLVGHLGIDAFSSANFQLLLRKK